MSSTSFNIWILSRRKTLKVWKFGTGNDGNDTKKLFTMEESNLMEKVDILTTQFQRQRPCLTFLSYPSLLLQNQHEKINFKVTRAHWERLNWLKVYAFLTCSADFQSADALKSQIPLMLNEKSNIQSVRHVIKRFRDSTLKAQKDPGNVFSLSPPQRLQYSGLNPLHDHRTRIFKFHDIHLRFWSTWWMKSGIRIWFGE